MRSYRGEDKLLRHSSITAAVERAGYDDVQEFVGHTRRDMTKRYGKPNVDRLKKVLRNHDQRSLEAIWKLYFGRTKKEKALKFQGLLLSKLVEAAGIEPASRQKFN